MYFNARAIQLSRHSPVTVLEGVVTDAGHIQNRGGSTFTTIQLRKDDGGLTPVFDTHGMYMKQGQPPVHQGDRMRASFYLWDYSGREREPFAIEILTGKGSGWSYRDEPQGWALSWVAGSVALAFYCYSLYRAYRAFGRRRNLVT